MKKSKKQEITESKLSKIKIKIILDKLKVLNPIKRLSKLVNNSRFQKFSFISLALLLLVVISSVIMFRQQYLTNFYQDYAKVVQIMNGVGASGTGFHFKYNNKTYIITNAHICKYQEGLPMVVVQYRGSLHVKGIVAISGKADLCAIEAVFDDGADSISNPSTLNPFALSLGHGAASNVTLKTGDYGSRFVKKMCLETPCAQLSLVEYDSYSVKIEGGNSGSPMFDLWGNVIGVVSAVDSKQAYTVPPVYLEAFLKELK